MAADVAGFVESQQRYVCERLSALLTPGQCEANRRRVGFNAIFSCQDCAGLTKGVELGQRLSSGPVICLDFSACLPVYERLQEHGIDAEQIIGLLEMLLDGQLKERKSCRK